MNLAGPTCKKKRLVKGKVLWKENMGRRMEILTEINQDYVSCVQVIFLFFSSIS